jgi:dihydroorotate dehydrogenase
MYSIARKLLFLLDPETAHTVSLQSFNLLSMSHLARLVACRPKPDPRTVMGIEFPNPVGLAAGLDKNGDYLNAMATLGFGFLEIGTTTPKPQPGNPMPRMFRLPAQRALINRLGFNNKGVDYLVGQVQRSGYKGVLGINIGKNRDTPLERAVDDYLHCLNRVYDHASYVTINISSPNTVGLRTLQEDAPLSELIGALIERRGELEKRHGRFLPLVVKIAPDLDPEQLDSLAATLNHCGPDAVLATNTTISRPGLEQHPLAQQAGGLSGAPLLGLANKTLAALRKKLDKAIPIIGVGGIMNAEDAASKIEAGAELIQIYTGLIYQGPQLVRDAARGVAGH